MKTCVLRNHEFDENQLGATKIVYERIETVQDCETRSDNIERLRGQMWVCPECAREDEVSSLADILDCASDSETLEVIDRTPWADTLSVIPE